MRTKSVKQMYLDFILPSSPTKVVAAYRAKYASINALLLANPAVLDLVHADFCRWLSSSDKGRESLYTSEEVLRALVVMFVGFMIQVLQVILSNYNFFGMNTALIILFINLINLILP